MDKLFSIKKLSERSPFWLVCGWSLILLANFVPTFPQPATIIGYLWKVEFALGALILLTFVFALKFSKDKFNFIKFTDREIRCIVLPIILFTVWSGLSMFWAQSLRNALHHTLLWACFSVFYLLSRQIVAQRRLLDVSLKLSGLIIGILGAACFVEYLNTLNGLNSAFVFRYYKYAEASVTLLPLYLALTLQKKSRSALAFGAVALIAWSTVLFSLSRTEFIAGFVCVGLFFALVFTFKDRRKYLTKTAVILSVFFVFVVLTQSSILKSEETSTVNRFANDEQSQSNLQWRFLVWGITLEAFKSQPLHGIGADNFVTDYRTAKENHSNLYPESKLLEIDEHVLAERSHNEFLQILAELGVVGIFLFGWLLCGIGRIAFAVIGKSASLLSIASFAGIAAFLVSSIASSYSFRVPANGVCFFFLVALAASGLRRHNESAANERTGFDLVKLKPAFVGFGLVICSAMMIFSGVRGVSLMYLQNAFQSTDKIEAEKNLQTAIAFDTDEPLFRYLYGMQLFAAKRPDEAVSQMRFAIDNGIATSISYFNLASAQITARQNDQAEQTFIEALRVYPRSIFLRTAYAAFLKENARESEAQNEYQKADRINPKQAVSWWTAHTEGMTKLSLIDNRDDKFVRPMDLKPADGIYALIDVQKQNNPELVRK